MSADNGNDAAFPIPHGFERGGLTKREYLAGLAMQGLLCPGGAIASPERAAELARIYADALLAELDKEQK